jgi:16S rRNA (cytidine1402-2'-O)-methyltransferase
LYDHIAPMEIHLLPLPISEEDPLNWFSDRHKSALLASSLFFVENVRTARRFISGLKLGINIANLHFEVLDKDTTLESVQTMVSLLKEKGKAVVMSEAGCPGIADPGGLLVDKVQNEGGKVIPYIGPSSILLGLMASGLNGQHFTFHGYLPQKIEDRTKAIQKLERESRNLGSTQIFIETPYRNKAMWESLLASLHPQTRLAYALGLTSANEVVRQMRVIDWKREDSVVFPKVPAIFLFQSGA